MKEFQKVQMIAKNLPTGSYAAGCPQYRSGAGGDYYGNGPGSQNAACKYCETTK